jgi:hypothetical protein
MNASALNGVNMALPLCLTVMLELMGAFTEHSNSPGWPSLRVFSNTSTNTAKDSQNNAANNTS